MLQDICVHFFDNFFPKLRCVGTIFQQGGQGQKSTVRHERGINFLTPVSNFRGQLTPLTRTSRSPAQAVSFADWQQLLLTNSRPDAMPSMTDIGLIGNWAQVAVVRCLCIIYWAVDADHLPAIMYLVQPCLPTHCSYSSNVCTCIVFHRLVAWSDVLQHRRHQ